MSESSLPAVERADKYCLSRAHTRLGSLGQGKDGGVWMTSHQSALKIHDTRESYQSELEAYIRFQKMGLKEIAGFKIPALVDFEDAVLAIEMTIVSPPFIVDFASARLDIPPDLIEDDGNTLYDMVRERFGERADEVMAIHYQLIDRAGVYLTDLHGHNIKFA